MTPRDRFECPAPTSRALSRAYRRVRAPWGGRAAGVPPPTPHTLPVIKDSFLPSPAPPRACPPPPSSALRGLPAAAAHWQRPAGARCLGSSCRRRQHWQQGVGAPATTRHPQPPRRGLALPPARGSAYIPPSLHACKLYPDRLSTEIAQNAAREARSLAGRYKHIYASRNRRQNQRYCIGAETALERLFCAYRCQPQVGDLGSPRAPSCSFISAQQLSQCLRTACSSTLRTTGQRARAAYLPAPVCPPSPHRRA